MITWGFILILLVSSILTAKDKPDETVLVKIGDKEIKLDEFLYRSEFTVRPRVVKDKLSALNNLISEKILALEAEKEGIKFLQNPVFNGKIKGIKEQMMREKLQYEVAYDKVVLDTNEINKAYRHSMREYDVEFYVMKSDSVAERIGKELKDHPERTNEIFAELKDSVGRKPVHTVKYLDKDDDSFQDHVLHIRHRFYMDHYSQEV